MEKYTKQTPYHKRREDKKKRLFIYLKVWYGKEKIAQDPSNQVIALAKDLIRDVKLSNVIGKKERTIYTTDKKKKLINSPGLRLDNQGPIQESCFLGTHVHLAIQLNTTAKQMKRDFARVYFPRNSVIFATDVRDALRVSLRQHALVEVVVTEVKSQIYAGARAKKQEGKGKDKGGKGKGGKGKGGKGKRQR